MPASETGESGRPKGSMKRETSSTLWRQAALEHVHLVGEVVALELRVFEDDDDILGALVALLDE